MKKYLSLIAFVMMAVVSLSLTACGDDDDVEESIEASICGKWVCVSADYNGFSKEDATKEGDIFYINEDHTYRITGGVEENGTWNKEGNKLICTLDGISWTYTITKLTNKELIIVADLLGVTLSFKRQPIIV